MLSSAAVGPFVRALIVLHRTYSPLPAGARLHVLIRFLTCPFLRVVAAIPPGVRTLLEVGSGHALFSRLAVAAGVRRAVAVEPDIRKVTAVRPVDGISYVAGFDGCIRGEFDVVSLIDVLYLVPEDEWDALLLRLRARLAPGGTLLIKEMDPDARIKNGWNRLQETLSVRVLRITLGSAMRFERVPDLVARLERLGFTGVTAQRIDAGYPHPHVLYAARA